MLTKEKLYEAAKEAEVHRDHIYIIKTKEDIKVITKPASNFLRNRKKIMEDPNILKIVMTDSILRYDYSQWQGHDVSIDVLIDSINKEYA